MDSIVVKLSLFVFLLFFSAFFASSESALFSLGRFRIRRLQRAGQKKFEAARELLKQPTKLISTLLIGNELANGAIGVVGSSLVYDLLEHRVENQALLPILAIALVLPFLLIFGEIVPKTIGIKHAERVTAFNSVPLSLFSTLVKPLRNAIVWIPEKIVQSFGKKENDQPDVSEEMFRTMVDISEQEGILDEQEKELIHNVFKLDDVNVATIMTPKPSVSYLLSNSTIKDANEKIKNDGYSRYPVLDREGKKVVGLLYAKDLLSPEPHDENESIARFLRKPLLVNETLNAMTLFARFKRMRTHFSVVVHSKSKEILGVISLEDILEEIFGAIRDERDMEEAK